MYKAILFHPEGDYVTDFSNSETVEEVWDRVADMGSRWIFYPIVFVATDKTIVSTPEHLEHLQGRRIRTVKRYIEDVWNTGDKDFICSAIEDGALFAVYPNTLKRTFRRERKNGG
jgi:MoaA/NifB/PqqE/SkfB family radical SAM enzyme